MNFLKSGPLVLVLLALAAPSAVLSQDSADDANEDHDRFRVAVLKGASEVPPVDSDATGAAGVRIESGDNEIDYALAIDGLQATAAHVHLGAAGSNGPILFSLRDESAVENDIIAGDLHASEFTALPDQGINTFQDLIAAIEAGNTYVNVHTEENPDGEIRGQLVAPSS